MEIRRRMNEKKWRIENSRERKNDGGIMEIIKAIIESERVIYHSRNNRRSRAIRREMWNDKTNVEGTKRN